MTLTLRQVAAYTEFGSRLDRIERANDLWVTATGAQGDGKTIEKTIKDLGG